MQFALKNRVPLRNSCVLETPEEKTRERQGKTSVLVLSAWNFSYKRDEDWKPRGHRCGNMIPKWLLNDIWIISKWWPNDPPMIPNDVQMISKWCPNDAQMMSKWCLNDVQMIPKLCPSDVQMMPKWSPNDVQIMSKWCPHDVQMMSKWCPNDV